MVTRGRHACGEDGKGEGICDLREQEGRALAGDAPWQLRVLAVGAGVTLGTRALGPCPSERVSSLATNPGLMTGLLSGNRAVAEKAGYLFGAALTASSVSLEENLLSHRGRSGAGASPRNCWGSHACCLPDGAPSGHLQLRPSWETAGSSLRGLLVAGKPPRASWGKFRRACAAGV